MVDGSTDRKPTVSGRVPQDTYDRLEDYCEDRDLSKADVVRRSIEDYLDREELQEDMSNFTRAQQEGTVVDVIEIGLLLALLVVTLSGFGVI